MSQLNFDLLSSVAALDTAPATFHATTEDGDFTAHLARARSETDAPEAADAEPSESPPASKPARESRPKSERGKSKSPKPGDQSGADAESTPAEDTADSTDAAADAQPAEDAAGSDSREEELVDVEPAVDGSEVPIVVPIAQAVAVTSIELSPAPAAQQAATITAPSEVAAARPREVSSQTKPGATAASATEPASVGSPTVQLTPQPSASVATPMTEQPPVETPEETVAATQVPTTPTPAATQAVVEKAAVVERHPAAAQQQQQSPTVAQTTSSATAPAVAAGQAAGQAATAEPPASVTSEDQPAEPEPTPASKKDDTPQSNPVPQGAATTKGAVARKTPVVMSESAGEDEEDSADEDPAEPSAATPSDAAPAATAPTAADSNTGANAANAVGSAVGASASGSAKTDSPSNTATSGTGTADNDKTEQARAADRARFAQRVSRAFEAVGERNGSIRLKLSPPELGSLRLEVSVQGGVLSARLEAETPAARNLLLESLPELRDRLAQQDIRVERFDVELMDRRPGSGAEQWSGQPQSERRPTPQSAAQGERRSETGSASTTADGLTSRPGDSNHLNIVI
jgi:flagellar hook-length control protein FliK